MQVTRFWLYKRTELEPVVTSDQEPGVCAMVVSAPDARTWCLIADNCSNDGLPAAEAFHDFAAAVVTRCFPKPGALQKTLWIVMDGAYWDEVRFDQDGRSQRLPIQFPGYAPQSLKAAQIWIGSRGGCIGRETQTLMLGTVLGRVFV